MAIATAITRPRVTEDASFTQPSYISTLFSCALGALETVVARERDIADVDIWDPAFRSWLTAAERAQDRLADLQHLLMAARVDRPSDRPLKRAAFLLQATLGAERPDDIACLRQVAREMASSFLLDEDSATNRQVNGMLRRALALYEEFLALDLVGHAPEDPLGANLEAGLGASLGASLGAGL